MNRCLQTGGVSSGRPTAISSFRSRTRPLFEFTETYRNGVRFAAALLVVLLAGCTHVGVPDPFYADKYAKEIGDATKAVADRLTKTKAEFTEARNRLRPEGQKFLDFTLFTSREEVAKTRELVLNLQTKSQAHFTGFAQKRRLFAAELRARKVPADVVDLATADYGRWSIFHENYSAIMLALDEQTFVASLGLLDLATESYGRWVASTPANTSRDRPAKFVFFNERDNIRYRLFWTALSRAMEAQDAMDKTLTDYPEPPYRADPMPGVTIETFNPGNVPVRPDE